MENTNFWNLRSPESTTKLAEWAEDMDFESTVVCPIDDGHQRAGRRLPDLSVILPGGAVQDIAWTWYGECLVQDHVLELFRASAFTGFDVRSVKVRFKRATDRRPPRLWELVVTGWGGFAPPESGFEVIEHCEACGDTSYSRCTHPEKLIDVSQWDGSDFFFVWPLPRFIFVTSRVVQAIRHNRLTGVRLKTMNELSIMGAGPGRLSYWMPEVRARQLREEFRRRWGVPMPD
jgi:hypothetical protein